MNGAWSTLEHHRGASHSVLVMAAAAPLFGALGWRWPGRRRGTALGWSLLAFLALVSHALLDTCTPYGTELLAPFSHRRFAIDAVSIVDLMITLPLLAAAIRARWGHDRQRSARFARGALVLAIAYLGLGWAQSQRALAWAREDLAATTFTPTAIRAMPTLGNVLVYRVIARDETGRFRVAHLSLSAPRTPRWYVLRDDEDPLIDAFERDPRSQLFERVAMGMAPIELMRGDMDFTVRMTDLRYGSLRDPRQSFLGVDAAFGLEGQPLGVERWRHDPDLGAELATLWAFLIGDDEKLSETLALRGQPARSPSCTSASSATAAVSLRRVRAPSPTPTKPCRSSMSRSYALQPPSGPSASTTRPARRRTASMTERS